MGGGGECRWGGRGFREPAAMCVMVSRHTYGPPNCTLTLCVIAYCVAVHVIASLALLHWTLVFSISIRPPLGLCYEDMLKLLLSRLHILACVQYLEVYLMGIQNGESVLRLRRSKEGGKQNPLPRRRGHWEDNCGGWVPDQNSNWDARSSKARANHRACQSLRPKMGPDASASASATTRDCATVKNGGRYLFCSSILLIICAVLLLSTI